jgi:hypothetical protein
VAALLPLNAEIARLGSRAIFCTRFPEHPFTHDLQSVAQRLLDRSSSMAETSIA